jgi:hypothetical protein
MINSGSLKCILSGLICIRKKAEMSKLILPEAKFVPCKEGPPGMLYQKIYHRYIELVLFKLTLCVCAYKQKNKIKIIDLQLYKPHFTLRIT